MSFYLIKTKSGQYSPVDDTDYEASKGVGVGNVVKCSSARNYQFHKKAMALLNLGHENQSTYQSFEVYRKVITIKAGFFSLGEIDDHEIPLADSLSYESMSAQTFEAWYNATLEVIATDLKTKSSIIKQQLSNFY